MSKSQALRQKQVKEKEVVSYDLPDGGWGWWILLASIINLLLITFIGPCFGIIFYDPLVEMGASSTLIAWISNLCNLITNFSIPLSGSLAKEFSWRIVAFVGTFFVSASMILSAFASSAGYMIFTYSILGGIGVGLAMTCCFMMPPQYFDKRLGIAQNTICLGISTGQLLAPPFIRYLQSEYGFRGSTIITGGIILNCCVGASLYQPAEWHWKNKKVKQPLLSAPQVPSASHRRSSIYVSNSYLPGLGSLAAGINHQNDDKTEKEYCYNNRLCIVLIEVGKNMLKSITVLKIPKVLILCLMGTITFNSLINFYVFIPFALEAAGYSLSDGATSISVAGLGALITRIIMAPISDRPWFNQRIVYCAGSALMSLTAIGFIFLGNIYLKYAMMVIFGVGLAMNTTFYLCLMVKYCGVDDLPEINGASGICVGIGFIMQGPLLGLIRDRTGSYVLTLCILSGLLFLPVLLFMLMPKPQDEQEAGEEEQQKEKINI